LTGAFLGALALVLAGFSGALYGLARSSLSRQADERIDAALLTLTAAVEIQPEGLEWEPNARMLDLGRDADPAAVRWTVRDDRGKLVAGSLNLPGPGVLAGLPLPGRSEAHRYRRVGERGRAYRVHQKAVRFGSPVLREDLPPNYYEALVLTAAVGVEPMEATLRNLARAEAGLSLAVWLLAAAGGRALCRRALAPVTRMADAARAMSAAEIGQRLPEPATGDELQGLAEAFNGLLARLADAFERQQRFTGDASHQLRTPLAAMLGQIDVALRRPRPEDDYRRVLGLVRDQAAHLGQIVEALLFLARADAEAGPPDLRVVDLTAWARGHVGRWQNHPRAGDLVLELPNAAAGPVAVRVNTPLLAQLVDNLLDNALKYSEPGTAVRVRVGRSGEPGSGGGMAVLAVEDRGAGIAAEDLPHLFEPFFRSRRAREQGRPGVGLGLAVAQRIAGSFGGSLAVRSQPGQGSTFVLTLPTEGGPGKVGSCAEDATTQTDLLDLVGSRTDGGL
jgi:signal transduction histidine kinase